MHAERPDHGDRARHRPRHAGAGRHRRGRAVAHPGDAQPVAGDVGAPGTPARRRRLRRRVPRRLGERAGLPDGGRRPAGTPAPGRRVEGDGPRPGRRGGAHRPARRSRLPGQLQVPLEHPLQRVPGQHLRLAPLRRAGPGCSGGPGGPARRRGLVRRGGPGRVPGPLRVRPPAPLVHAQPWRHRRSRRHPRPDRRVRAARLPPLRCRAWAAARRRGARRPIGPAASAVPPASA